MLRTSNLHLVLSIGEPATLVCDCLVNLFLFLLERESGISSSHTSGRSAAVLKAKWCRYGLVWCGLPWAISVLRHLHIEYPVFFHSIIYQSMSNLMRNNPIAQCGQLIAPQVTALRATSLYRSGLRQTSSFQLIGMRGIPVTKPTWGKSS